MDTRRLVEQAYAQVGVTMPPGAWGQPWKAWLPAALDGGQGPVEAVRRRKARVYQQLLRNDAPTLLPPWEVLRTCGTLGVETRLLTGASLAAVRELVRHIGVDLSSVLAWELTAEARAILLNSLPRERRRVVYIDDLPDAVTPLLRPEIHVIRYTGQTAAELWEQIDWTPSSLPRAETSA